MILILNLVILIIYMSRIEAATDGSQLKNRRGGWGFVVNFIKDSTVLSSYDKSGGELSTTNNKMELVAMINCLEYLLENHYDTLQITIFVDSEYLQNGLTKWMPKWKSKNWKLSNGGKVKNKSLWEKLDLLYNGFTRTPEIIHVDSHKGHVLNEQADKLATLAALNITH